MNIVELRREYHRQISQQIIRIRIIGGHEIPSFADKDSKTSVRIAQGIVERLGFPKVHVASKIQEKPLDAVESDEVKDIGRFISNLSMADGMEVKEQTAGGLFEKLTMEFLHKSFQQLEHLRPGNWIYQVNSKISRFDQYSHLAEIAQVIKDNKSLASTLGRDYIITPDIVIARLPILDDEFNRQQQLLADNLPEYTPLRKNNSTHPVPILHASISCKWTLRSDRSQNARTEALNLIRNRKGNLPHVVAVTAEPYPNRLASLALGTGDLDCVYHFALRELKETVVEQNIESEVDLLNMMIEGRRLRDISDLPFDLAI